MPEKTRQEARQATLVKHLKSNPTIYTSAQLAALGDSQLVQTIADATYNGVRCLWTFDSDVATVLSPARLQLFATQINTESANVEGNAERLAQLALMFQIAYYHDFYETTYTIPSGTTTAVALALKNLGTAANFQTSSATNVDYLRAQWANSLNNVECVNQNLTAIYNILNRYWTNRVAYSSLYYENSTVSNLLNAMASEIGSKTATWTNLITPQMLTLVTNYANEVNPLEANVYLSTLANWLLGNFSKLSTTTKNGAHQSLSTGYATLPHSGAPWAWCVYSLEQFYGAALYSGTALNMTAIRNELKAMLFPNTIKYDQNKMIFRTALAAKALDPLYDALQEVEGQFFRVATQMTPVAGDTNTSITFVIYASPDDYSNYQPLLYGLDTNNGGIYIEQDDTLYTYDRTSSQSIYTLEELVRHEYTHYLDGRYNISGLFGAAGTLYANSTITWYVEGLAEMMAGSSRINGPLPRRGLLDQIDDDGVGGRLTLTQLFAATYNDGFKFYRYGASFMLFLKQKHQELLTPLMTAIRGNNAANVTSWINARKADAALQTEFTNWLNTQLADDAADKLLCHEDVPTLHTPGVPGNNSAALLTLLRNQAPAGASPTIAVQGLRFHYQDKITTTVTGSSALYPHAMRAALATMLDRKLNTVAPKAENFHNAVGWYTNLVPNGATVTADVYIEGPYSPTSTLKLDHFNWNALSYKVPVNFDFPVRLEARTDLNKLFSGYNGLAKLKAISGFGDPKVIGERYLNYTTYVPLNTNANDGRVQVIYHASEIAQASQIKALALDVQVLPLPMTKFTIRLKHTTLNQFPAGGTAWDNTGWTTCYAKDTTINTTGTVKFTFTTPFNYNGTDNLLIEFSHNNNSYGNRGEVWYTYTPGENRTQAGFRSLANDDPLTWTGSTPTPELSEGRPNITLYGPDPLTIVPPQVTLTNGVYSGNLKITTSANNVRITASDLAGASLGTTNEFAVNGYGIAITAVQGTVQRSPNTLGYSANSTVTLTPQPNAGYLFSHWSGSDVPAGKTLANPLVLTMTKHYTLTANFIKKTAAADWALYEE